MITKEISDLLDGLTSLQLRLLIEYHWVHALRITRASIKQFSKIYVK